MVEKVKKEEERCLGKHQLFRFAGAGCLFCLVGGLPGDHALEPIKKAGPGGADAQSAFPDLPLMCAPPCLHLLFASPVDPHSDTCHLLADDPTSSLRF